MKGVLLKAALIKTARSQTGAAKLLGVSSAAISLLVHRGDWPRREADAFRSRLVEFLESRGITREEITAAFRELDEGTTDICNHEEVIMIRKQVLSPQARRKFGVLRDIFTDEFTSAEDVFFSPEIRYVRENIYHLAKHGGMMALVGESGSGKTTLLRELKGRLEAEEARIILIEPSVLGMDNGNKNGIPIKPTHLCEAILGALGSPYKGKLSSEALFKLVHTKLKESARAGYRHLLVIEEAHSIPKTLFKNLKRFQELDLGMTRLLAILLVGQRELKNKLAETDQEVKEVVQRTELVELNPMDDLEGYVRHRCTRAGANFDAIFAPDALPALTVKLRGPSSKGRDDGQSMLYPLLVGNVLTKAINTAERLKMDRVTADVVNA